MHSRGTISDSCAPSGAFEREVIDCAATSPFENARAFTKYHDVNINFNYNIYLLLKYYIYIVQDMFAKHILYFEQFDLLLTIS